MRWTSRRAVLLTMGATLGGAQLGGCSSHDEFAAGGVGVAAPTYRQPAAPRVGLIITDPPPSTDCPVSDDTAEDAALFVDGPVTNLRYGRQTFYSWTTEEQETALRAGASLYSKEALPQELLGQLLYGVPALRDLAAVLTTERFKLGRYGWSRPFATVGYYGDRLLGIRLRPEALVVGVGVGEEWTVQTVDGTPVDRAVALAEPERIGAVFVSRHGCNPHMMGECAAPYREYYLSNGEMVEEWSIGTADLDAALDADLRALAQLSSSVAWTLVDSGCAWNRQQGLWSGEVTAVTAVDRCAATLFTATEFCSSSERLTQAALKLALCRRPLDPLVVRPNTPSDAGAGGSAGATGDGSSAAGSAGAAASGG